MKSIFLFILIACVALLGYAQYLQHFEDLLPCPLCVAQRLAYWLIGITACLRLLHQPKNSMVGIYAIFLMLFSFSGALVAARHVWLIRFPESFECGISPEEAFLNSLPLAAWWPSMFEANGDCAHINWTFLSLTIPDWSLATFICFSVLAIYMLVVRRPYPRG